MCRVGASREVRNGSEKSRGDKCHYTQRRVDNWIELSLASLQKKTHTVCVKSKLRLTWGTHCNLTCTWPSTHACLNHWTQSSLAFIQGTILCLLDSKCELKSGGLTCESGASHEANLSLQRKCSFRVLQLQSKFQLILLLDGKKMVQQICKAQPLKSKWKLLLQIHCGCWIPETDCSAQIKYLRDICLRDSILCLPYGGELLFARTR